MVIILKYYI